MRSVSRTSADAGIAMALGCTLLYHSAVWFWMARTLTIIGTSLPICILALALLRRNYISNSRAVIEAPSYADIIMAIRYRDVSTTVTIALYTIVTLVLTVMAANLALSGEVPYRIYALSNVLAQVTLCAVWIAWLAVAWRSLAAWLGLAGALIGTLGFAANAHLRFVGPVVAAPSYVPPDPWCSTRSGECGPVDMLSRVLPHLVLPEVALVGVFVLIWLRWGLRPRLMERGME